MTNIEPHLEARIDAILALPEAAQRSELAHYIALDTHLSVDEAREMLNAAAIEPDTSHSMRVTNAVIYSPIKQEV